MPQPTLSETLATVRKRIQQIRERKETIGEENTKATLIEPVLAANYVVVHVDIGRGEKNQDLMAKYDVPMKRGIPGLAVLDAGGKLIYSQKNGEFENARALAPEDVLAFLNQWRPAQQSR